jgi:DNA-binding transcriptional LysR family regulator
MDLLSGMTVFARVVEEASFAKAAAALGLSRSAASKRVAWLEDHLGARLLNRTTRTISLTEVGRAYYERCARILDEVEDAAQAVASLHDAPRGTLRVNAPMSFGQRHVGPAVSAFLCRWPEMSIDLSLTDRRVDVVDEGYDVVVRIMAMADSSLIARKITTTSRVTCASPEYLARRGTPTAPADLAGHDCFEYANLSPAGEWVFRRGDQTQRIKIAGRLRADNGDVLRCAALAGLGLIQTPTFIVADDLAAGRLVPVLDDYAASGIPVWAVYPHNRHLSTKVRMFVDFLADRFGAEVG